eukprot:m.72303 g.72303  ORF g.72303 m.72303 type:complete len:331 (-) comp18716_c0_seq1:242-1234(-)
MVATALIVILVLLGGLAAMTSLSGMVNVVVILLKAPVHMAISVIGFFVPSLFYKDLRNETILITGAASGIGRLMALEFAGLGPKKLVLLDVNAQGVADVAKEVADVATDGCTVHTYTANLASRPQTQATMQTVLKEVGPVTILINNAGVVTGKKFLECDDEKIELTMKVNAEAHFWTTKAVLPTMYEANHGHIVTIASSAGLCGVPGLADYCASKHAAVGFDESIRMEARKLGKSGVKTTVICPFFIKTGMFEGAKSRWPMLVPLLEPEYASSKIVRAVRCNQAVLIMPLVVHLTPIARALFPVPIFDELIDWMGVLDTMEDFVGRKKAE